MARIAMDLDGVCYEWDRTAQYMLREYRGQTQLHQPSTGWNWIQENCSPEDWKWLWSEGVKRGLFRYGHVTTGAIIGLRKLIEAGHKLEVVTHRPASAVRDTLAWLDYIHIAWDGVHLLTNSEPKHLVSKADIMVDDKPENVLGWAGTGRKAVLFDRPWNQECPPHDNIVRVKGWSGVVECLTSR